MIFSLNMSTYSFLFQYKKQQRELQFKFRKHNCEDVPVLTIDQCQGKEADIVAISMVKKPTGFLNKNRLNVALSRVRRKLYLVADKNKFEEASRNSNWECFELAKDLLKLAADSDDSGILAEDGSDVVDIAREDVDMCLGNLEEAEIMEEYIKSPEKEKTNTQKKKKKANKNYKWWEKKKEEEKKKKKAKTKK
jgi:hypothetical protein